MRKRIPFSRSLIRLSHPQVDLAGLDLWLDSVILKVLSKFNDSIIKGKEDKQVTLVHHEDHHLKDLSGRYYLDNRFMLIKKKLYGVPHLRGRKGKGRTPCWNFTEQL